MDYRNEWKHEISVGNMLIIRSRLNAIVKPDINTNPDCITIPAGGTVIFLEVKWDEFLPAIIRKAVGLDSRRSGAFSKYRVAVFTANNDWRNWL